MIEAGQHYRFADGSGWLMAVDKVEDGVVYYRDCFEDFIGIGRMTSLIQWEVDVENGTLVLVKEKKDG